MPSSQSAARVAMFAAWAVAVAGPVHAATLTARIDVPTAGIRVTAAEAGDRIDAPGFARRPHDGAAALPFVERMFYVPEGFRVAEATVIPVGTRRLENAVRLEPAAPAAGSPVSRAAASTAGPPTSGPGHSLSEGWMAGHRLHSVALWPVGWEPGTGRATLTSSFDVELELVPAPDTDVRRERPAPRAEAMVYRVLRDLVVNPQDVPAAPPAFGSAQRSTLSGFAPEELPSIDGSAVEMLIITTDALAPQFQPLADWKTRKGVPTVIRTVEWIDVNYPGGVDRPERIRHFIRDAYRKWGTYYVLLGGDHHIVEPRHAWSVFFLGGTEIPTDQYYACLDGDWNGDGDDRFGEGQFVADPGDSADAYPEVFVGRAAVEDSAEVATFVAKSFTYDRTPPANYVETHGALAEVLFPADWEFGVDLPESITLDGKALVEDSLDVHVPGHWTRTKRYQSDGTEDRPTAIAELNFGHHVLSVAGHGDAFKFSAGNGSNPLVFGADTDTLTNGDRLTFFNAVACNPNQIDLESQGEGLMNNPGGGAIAVLGSSRIDFAIQSVAASAQILRVGFQVGVAEFGAMSQLGRLPFVGSVQTDEAADRWSWLSKMLLGDPELRLRMDEPQEFLVTHAATAALGDAALSVSVTDTLSAPVAGALVCLSDGMGTYSRAFTDGAGTAVLPWNSAGVGAADLVVSAAEFRPYEGTVTINAAAGPVLAVAATVDDDGTGASVGNGDGGADAGETVELQTDVTNAGGAPADSVVVTASVEAGGSATFDLRYGGVADPARVFVGSEGVNPAAVPFTLDFASPVLDYTGTPSMTFSPDTSSTGTAVGSQGIFLWQDHDGWHLRWGSATDSVGVEGTVTTDGRVRTLATDATESADSTYLAASQDTLAFVAVTDAADLYDGLDFTLADSTMLSVTTASFSPGDLVAAAQGSGAVVLDVAASARVGQIAAVDVDVTSTTGGPWTHEVRLLFQGPDLSAYVFTVQDSGAVPVSGNGNGVIEVGETVRLTPTVRNFGNGEAGGVNGAATAASGITFVDAADAYGAVPSQTETAGTDGYVFTVDDSSGTTLDLLLTDDQGRSWAKTLDFVMPAAPDSVWFTSSSARIDVRWTPSSATDAAGYNIYRSDSTGTNYVKQNVALLTAATTFADQNLAVGSQFFYYVSAVDSSGNESTGTLPIEAWTTLAQAPGWPKPTSGFVFPGIMMLDADADSLQEIYVGSHDFNFYAWGHDGDDRAGFPIGTTFEVWGTSAAADLDGDNDSEIVFGSRDARAYAVNSDGSPVFGANAAFLDLAGTGSGIRSSATISDIDNDAQFEILIGTDSGTLYAFNHDGTGMIDSTGLLFTAPPGNLSASIWGTVAVGDMDKDGVKEIAFAAWNDSVYVIDATGAVEPGFPRAGTNDFRAGVTLGDLDNDGTLELIAPCFDGNIYVYNHDGSDYLPGGILASIVEEWGAGAALANLDADPELEIVIGAFDANLYAFNHDGTSFLTGTGGVFAALPLGPGGNDGIAATPIIVDVDGDGDFEILVGHRNFNFYGFHHDGTQIAGMPIPTGDSIFSTAAAGDLDGDGDVDVAFASYDATVNVLDFPGASTEAAYEWPTTGGNNYRTALYGDKGPAVDTPVVISPPGWSLQLAQSVPNPFGAWTTIDFSLPAAETVSLRVYNVGGRLVRTLVNERLSPGPHRVQWDGRDNRGRKLSSGIYFYRLDNRERTLTRKLVLLR